MVTEQEKWTAVKEMIDAMQSMDEPQRQFMLGYAAGVCAKYEQEEKQTA